MSDYYPTQIGSSKWHLPNKYQNLEAIGSGSFGQVARAYLGQSNKQVAIKKLHQPFKTIECAKRTYREFSVLAYVKHDNVISLLDVFYSPDAKEVYLVTHLMEADLHTVIRGVRLTDEHVKSYMAQILSGLSYIHSHGIIHRDLKPSNIAINGNSRLRILDFGLARATSNDMTGYVVTRTYRAPEVIYCWRQYNQAVDVWSVGCILAELITRKVLFPGTDLFNQLSIILDMVGTPSRDFISKISEDAARNHLAEKPYRERQNFRLIFNTASELAVDLLEKTLQFEPERRLTSAEALRHPYLQDCAVPVNMEVHGIYDQSFENLNLSVDQWKSLIIEKIDQFQAYEQID